MASAAVAESPTDLRRKMSACEALFTSANAGEAASARAAHQRLKKRYDTITKPTDFDHNAFFDEVFQSIRSSQQSDSVATWLAAAEARAKKESIFKQNQRHEAMMRASAKARADAKENYLDQKDPFRKPNTVRMSADDVRFENLNNYMRDRGMRVEKYGDTYLMFNRAGKLVKRAKKLDTMIMFAMAL